ncbi:MAG: sulfotransferase domain-containing protein [Desulfobacterales bacterium]|nr:sulfotransferase domain-containing protein [Desulfobacterales bacterium]
MNYANKLIIKKRRKINPPESIVGSSDFVFEEGPKLDFEDLWLKEISYISPYCIDDKNKRMLFAYVDKDKDLRKLHPFYYEAQRKYAKFFVGVPYDILYNLSDSLPDLDKKCIMLYSTGRCGSTFLCNLMGSINNIQSLSEPDAYSQMTLIRANSKINRDDELIQLIKAYTKMIYHHSLSKNPEKPVVVIKLRALSLFMGELINKALPSISSIFLYRNAIDVVNSFYGAFFDNPIMKTIKYLNIENIVLKILRFTYSSYVKTIPLLKNEKYSDFNSFDAFKGLGFIWLSLMEYALYLHEQYPDFLDSAIDYKDLREKPLDALKELLLACGIETDLNQDIDNIKKVIESNSQKGSRIASKGKRHVGNKEIEAINSILTRHDLIKSGDFLFPKTVCR